ncbi:MAG: cation:proton antiporter [Pseudanabaenaceae cyanobacterium bins.39]|nr:cation:proton antiporter [Pseudanabaenaceae cyanobacterium bins.39]
MIGQFILRLVIWFLLTANLHITNIIIGVIVALLLPHSKDSTGRLRDILIALGKIIWAIPQAYMEAVQMMLQPHDQESIVLEKAKAKRSMGLIFLEIFLITFTPKTIVLNHLPDGWYRVHYVRHRPNSKTLHQEQP